MGVETKQTLEADLKALKIPAELRGEIPQRGSRPRRRFWLIVAAAVAVIAGFVFIELRAPAVGVETERAQVTIGGAAAGTALIASGYVVPHHQVEVGSKVMGKVAWIGVEKGDKVKQGQLLVRLEDDEYRAQVDRTRGELATAEANYQMLKNGSRPEEIARDQAEMENARVTYDRTRQLASEGVLSQQQLDDAKSHYDTTLKIYELTKLGPRQELIDQARAAVEQARGDVAYAQTQLDATRVTAPVDGTVLDRVVEKGELVTTMFTGDRGAKSYVVSLADLGDLRVELDVNENDFARISIGQPSDIVLEAYPARHYPGKVIEISPQANRDKGTIQVKVQFLKPDVFVRPEMLARVAFQQPESSGVPGASSGSSVTIAKNARVERNGRIGVFVVEGGRAHLRQAELADPGGERLVVTQGLQGGEEVVVNPLETLQEGSRVITKPAAGGAQ
jgi:HlyD family secretion protein